MRVKIYASQTVKIADTMSRPDPSTVILQAIDATPVFFDYERGNLEFLDAGGNPRGGFFLTNAQPPIVLQGVKAQIWARAVADTFIEVQVMEVRLEHTSAAMATNHGPRRGYLGALNRGRRS